MILASFSVFILTWVAGFGLAHAAWKSANPWSIPLKLFLGIGLGLGITSCFYFLRLVVLPGQQGYLLIQAGLLLIVLFLLYRQNRFLPTFSVKYLSISRTQILLGLAAAIILALALQYSLVSARTSPHGDYDAHAIWNLRARFIHRLGENWWMAFSPNINRDFHMDYPLLVPMNVVGGWNTLNGEVLRVPAVQAILFLLGLAGVLFSGMAYLRSSSQAAIAAIVLLATPYVLQFSTFQTADIPLSYFFLASAVLFLLALEEPSSGLLVLCGLAAGLSAWTKNEGLTFVLIVAALGTAAFYKRGGKALFSLFGGMALPLLTLLAFKTLLAGRNDLLAGSGLFAIFQNVTDPERYDSIFRHFTSEMAILGGWPYSIVLLLAVYGLVMGRDNTTRSQKWIWLTWIVAAQFLAYFVIYMITPNDLEWQLTYSMSRLLIHLFPMVLLIFFLVVRTPDTLSDSPVGVPKLQQ